MNYSFVLLLNMKKSNNNMFNRIFSYEDNYIFQQNLILVTIKTGTLKFLNIYVIHKACSYV